MGWKIFELPGTLFMKDEDNKHVFAHAFFACECNVMSQAEKLGDCCADNKSQVEDILVFIFPRTRLSDWERGALPFGMYMSPLQTVKLMTCSHLALTHYFAYRKSCKKKCINRKG